MRIRRNQRVNGGFASPTLRNVEPKRPARQGFGQFHQQKEDQAMTKHTPQDRRNPNRGKPVYFVAIRRRDDSGTTVGEHLSQPLHSRFQMKKAVARWRKVEPDAFGVQHTPYH